MKEVAIYALLNGISHTAEIHNLEESTVRRWIRDLDNEKEPFFVRLRELLFKTSKKAGLEKTADLFGMPVSVLNILTQEEQPQGPLYLDSNSSQHSNIKPELKDEKPSKTLKRKALKMHIRGRSPHYISQHLKIHIHKISSWIHVYNQLRNKKVLDQPDKKYKYEEPSDRVPLYSTETHKADSNQSSIANSQISHKTSHSSDSEIEVVKMVSKPIEVIELDIESSFQNNAS